MSYIDENTVKFMTHNYPACGNMKELDDEDLQYISHDELLDTYKYRHYSKQLLYNEKRAANTNREYWRAYFAREMS